MNRLLKRFFPEYLPCSILAREPFIITAFWFDFYKKRKDFVEALPKDQKVYAIMKLGYHVETDKTFLPLIKEFDEVMELMPNLEITFMTNSVNEVKKFEASKLKSVFINQNVFLNENKYHIVKGIKKLYDAIYVARATPCKRHELARLIPTLLIIGGYREDEVEYYNFVRKSLPQATWIPKVLGCFIYRKINQARVALCLSEIEGAMYVSAEYLLCGIPIVNTPNIGGRDELFDEQDVLTVEPTAENIAHAVKKLIELDRNPEVVRQDVLAKMAPHRARYISYLKDIFAQNGQIRDIEFKWGNQFCFHKLGLRCRQLPWDLIRHGLKRELKK